MKKFAINGFGVDRNQVTGYQLFNNSFELAPHWDKADAIHGLFGIRGAEAKSYVRFHCIRR